MTDLVARFQKALSSGTSLVKAGPADTVMSFARSVAAGLSDQPRWLHCRFLYDAEGSRLFEIITAQPEYYPTRIEAGLLKRHASEIREITGPRTLVELGSGYSVKTEHLLSAYARDDDETRYVPVDVSVAALQEASRSIQENFDAVRFTGINGTYASALPILRQLSPQLVVFLGSTIGNFNEAESTAFWRSVAGHLPSGDFFLLGVDLVKDPDILEAAYNDAAGVTARFTKNYFARINRELGSDIDVDVIEHQATWNPAQQRMEIFSTFRETQSVRIEPLGLTFVIQKGERILLEISRKFRVDVLVEELRRYGFEVRRTFCDEPEWFGLLLLERIDDALLRASPDTPRQ